MPHSANQSATISETISRLLCPNIRLGKPPSVKILITMSCSQRFSQASITPARASKVTPINPRHLTRSSKLASTHMRTAADTRSLEIEHVTYQQPPSRHPAADLGYAGMQILELRALSRVCEKWCETAFEVIWTSGLGRFHAIKAENYDLWRRRVLSIDDMRW